MEFTLYYRGQLTPNDGRKAKHDLAKVRDVIARLRELRTALISAAVTGKIDVRGETA